MRALGTVLCCLPLLVATACGGAADEAPRNVLLLSIDTLRADALGVYGSDRNASPFLDRWSQRGVRFESAWSHSPKTAPSHMSLLTGLEPRVHGVGNLKTVGSPSLGPEATTMAEVFRANGYVTGGFTDGGNIKGSLGFDRGFDVYVSQKAKQWGQRAKQVREWLGSVPAGAPWFLFVHTYHVHDPYFPPPEVAARFVDPGYAGRIIGDREALERAMATEDLGASFGGHTRVLANYWNRVDHDSSADMEHLHDLYTAGVADLDQKLEVLFRWLEKEGYLDDTVVVVTSDHGEEFGEHGKVRHEQLWRECLHVPLMLRLPGDARAGTVIEAPVRHVDLLASVVDLARLPDPGLDDIGPSWAHWLEDPSRAEARAVYAEHRSSREVSLDLWALRSGGWLLHQSYEDSLTFHDLSADPLELAPVDGRGPRAELADLQLRELGRLQGLSDRYSAGSGVELSSDVREELEALGYLGGEDGG